MAVALARPQTVGGVTRVAGQGVAIVVLLDQSSSMNAVDFPADRGTRLISRLEAAKTTFTQFVEGRSDDLVGLYAFANYQDVVCPPTLDHGWLVDQALALASARPSEDGTNIGDAIVVGIKALLIEPPRKKVLVLLTDGNNEPGVPNPYDPEKAAMLAGELGITLHTIAIGRPGGVFHGVERKSDQAYVAEVEGPNRALLDRLAEITGGKGFGAADTDALSNVFRQIDKLEKSPVRGQILTRYDEHYAPWAGLALALLLFDRLLAQGRLRRLP
jgi:Ca-activated chloride channel family protein